MTIRKLIQTSPDPVRAIGARLCSFEDGDTSLCLRIWFDGALAACEAAYADHLGRRRPIEVIESEMLAEVEAGTYQLISLPEVHVAHIQANRSAVDEKAPPLFAALKTLSELLWQHERQSDEVIRHARSILGMPLPWESGPESFGLRALVGFVKAIWYPKRSEPLGNHGWLISQAVHYSGETEAARRGMLAALDRFVAVKATHPAWVVVTP
jgi:hypothetical protein